MTPRHFFSSLLFLLAAARVSAFTVGGLMDDEDSSMWGMLSERTSRSVTEVKGKGMLFFNGASPDRVVRVDHPMLLRANRFYFHGSHSLGEQGHFLWKLMPGTGGMSLEGGPSTYDPHPIGIGLGVRGIPRIGRSPFRLLVQGNWEWSFGSRKNNHIPSSGRGSESHDEMGWMERAGAAGVVWTFPRGSLSSGISYVDTRISVEFGDHRVRLRTRNRVGGFWNASLRLWKNGPYASFDGRFGNEKSFGAGVFWKMKP
jgi:hypothetical protein